MFYRSANLIITSSVMACLAIIAVGVRFWVRGARRIRVGADDFLIVFGLILALGLCICNIIGAAKYRFGNHEVFIEGGELDGWPEAWLLLGYGKIFYALQILHATAMPVIKASLLLFLRRIFGHVRGFRVAFWIVGAYIFLWWLTTFWMSIFQCKPISSNWGTTPEEMGDCIPGYTTWYSWAALLNVLSDVAIVIIPIPLVARLQLPMRQKVASLAILTTAIVVIIAGIGRTVGYFTYDHSSFDFSYIFYDFLIWTSIEPCLGVIGCCLPTMGPLLDLKHHTVFYSKIKSMFSRQSLSKTSPEPSPNNSKHRSNWVELTHDGQSQSRHSQAEHLKRDETTVDAESLGDHVYYDGETKQPSIKSV